MEREEEGPEDSENWSRRIENLRVGEGEIVLALLLLPTDRNDRCAACLMHA